MNAILDPTITKENYRKRGLLYLGDINSQHADERLITHVLAHGGVLGPPLLSEQRNLRYDLPAGSLYAMYLPTRLNVLIAPPLPADHRLTVDQAPKIGFVWTEDIDAYDAARGLAEMFEWLSIYWNILADDTYRLGVAQTSVPGKQGLYHRVLPVTK